MGSEGLRLGSLALVSRLRDRGVLGQVLLGRQVMTVLFSSRRRHTRCSRDWSSDVCSSDLFCRQRSWNSHSLQCRFRTRSGGEALVATSAIFGASFRTSSNKPSVLTFNVVCSSPWMILPKLTSRPSNSDNPSESNANNKRSSRVSLFLKLKRIGTNFAGLPLPSDTTRSIACC